MKYDTWFMERRNANEYRDRLRSHGYKAEVRLGTESSGTVRMYEVWSDYAEKNISCNGCGRLKKKEELWVYDNLASTPTNNIQYCPECMKKKGW